MESLAAIASTPPACAPDAVAKAVESYFGLAGEYAPLVSERDQNFCLACTDGRRFVVKVTSLAEPPETSDFQLGALLYLEGADVEVPSVVRTRDGAVCGFIDSPEGRHRLRVVTWIEGESLLAAGIDAARAADLGEALAGLDNALQDYANAGENPVLLWDLHRAGELRPLLPVIDDTETRQVVARVIDDFEAHVVAAELRAQVIHGDANPENVLLTANGTGFIDVSDRVRAPRIFDVAIAAAYLRSDGDDPLVHIRPFIAGYHAVAPLGEDETGLLFDLVRARLATTVTLLYWRMRDRSSDDDYRRKSLQVEGTASRFLAALERFGRANFVREINDLTRMTR